MCGEEGDGIRTRKTEDKAELEEHREEVMRQGYRCSEIKLLREEF
jgi:hypothetical protein